MNLTIPLQPKQKQLVELILSPKHTVIGYGGAAGGAKSHGIRAAMIMLHCYWAMRGQRINILIIRRMSGELEENHIVPLFIQYPELRKNFNVQKSILFMPTGGITKFGYAEHEDDIYSYQGKEYDYIFIDEAGQFNQTMIEYLFTRNRSTLPGLLAKTILTMNPIGVGFMYLKRIFISKSYEEYERAEDFYYLPAHIHDNIEWSKQALIERSISPKEYYSWTNEERREFTMLYSDYARKLARQPIQLRRALLDGDWEAFGGMFFKGLVRSELVVQPFKIPREWKLLASIDPAVSTWCSFGVYAIDFTGVIYKVATYYENERPAADHRDAIIEFLNTPPVSNLIGNSKHNPRNFDYIIAGKDAFAHRDRYAIVNSEVTFAEIFAQAGMYFTPATTMRKQGWWAMKQLIKDGKFKVFDGLNNPTLDEMFAVESDKRDPEDIKGKGNDKNVLDHALDETRYLIVSATSAYEEYEDNTPEWVKKMMKNNPNNIGVMAV